MSHIELGEKFFKFKVYLEYLVGEDASYSVNELCKLLAPMTIDPHENGYRNTLKNGGVVFSQSDIGDDAAYSLIKLSGEKIMIIRNIEVVEKYVVAGFEEMYIIEQNLKSAFGSTRLRKHDGQYMYILMDSYPQQEGKFKWL